jgi:glucose-1-phosphate thymidylyltransferase
LRSLSQAGIREVVVTTRPDTLDDHKKLFDSGFYEQFSFSTVSFAVQEKAAGMPDAIRAAHRFVTDSPIMVFVGDNLYSDNFSSMRESYRGGGMISLFATSDLTAHGAALAVKEVIDGVETLRVKHLEEKPAKPTGNYASVTPYIFDKDVFDRIDTLVPSARGELEIIDLQKSYLEEDRLTAFELQGVWLDCGNRDQILLAIKHRLTEVGEKSL